MRRGWWCVRVGVVWVSVKGEEGEWCVRVGMVWVCRLGRGW